METIVSGVGVLTSIGSGLGEFWNGLMTGRSGVRPVSAFDVSGHANKFACEIPEIAPSRLFPHETASMGRTTRMLMLAVEEALREAGLSTSDCRKSVAGLCVGTTMGEIEPMESLLRTGQAAGAGGPHAAADNAARLLGLTGPVWTFTNACAAGNFAIAKCMDELEGGRADFMIAAGVDVLSWIAFTGFSSLRAMSPDRCRPFDKDRLGMILGEGAGALVLETREHAEKRGAAAMASLLGYGFSCDAHHITQPDPSARGAVRAMNAALERAGLTPDRVGYVSAHGTGTLANDRMETAAIQAVFRDAPAAVPVSSIKGHIGHTLGAASAIEAVMCVKALNEGVFPPTLGLREADPICREERVDLIASPAACRAEAVLSNAYAFGGINSSLVIGHPTCTRSRS